MPIIYNCEWQTIEDFKKIPNISKLANTGIIINGVGYHTEYCNSKFETLARVDNLPWDMDRHDFPYQGSGIFGKTELFDNWKDAVIATIDTLTDYLQKQTPPEPIKEPEHLPQLPKSAPQSPHNTRAANYATPTPKAREIARKRPNSTVRKYRTVQRSTIRSALNTVTVNSPPIGRPHRTPYW